MIFGFLLVALAVVSAALAFLTYSFWPVLVDDTGRVAAQAEKLERDELAKVKAYEASRMQSKAPSSPQPLATSTKG